MKRTLSIVRTTQYELAEGARRYPEPTVPLPATRGDCLSLPRPCPFVRCRHHLAIDVLENGSIRFNQPGVDVADMQETCSLDAADRGGMTLDEVSKHFGLTRERVRQIEERAMRKLRRFGMRKTLGRE